MGQTAGATDDVQGADGMIWFSNVNEFLTMNGYGTYVWSAWGVTLGVLLFQVGHARVERRRLLTTLWQRQQRAARRAELQPTSSIDGGPV